jgi:hypothetical protein
MVSAIKNNGERNSFPIEWTLPVHIESDLTYCIYHSCFWQVWLEKW